MELLCGTADGSVRDVVGGETVERGEGLVEAVTLRDLLILRAQLPDSCNASSA